jgi:hypothetical protein
MEAVELARSSPIAESSSGRSASVQWLAGRKVSVVGPRVETETGPSAAVALLVLVGLLGLVELLGLVGLFGLLGLLGLSGFWGPWGLLGLVAPVGLGELIVLARLIWRAQRMALSERGGKVKRAQRTMEGEEYVRSYVLRNIRVEPQNATAVLRATWLNGYFHALVFYRMRGVRAFTAYLASAFPL